MQMALFERPVLFADFAAHWMSRYSSPPWVTAYTAYIRAGHLRANVLPAIGHLALADITPAVLEQVQREMLGRLQLSTVKGIFQGVIGPILRRAVRDGLIRAHPGGHLAWPRVQAEHPDPYTTAEVDRIIDWFRRQKPDLEPTIALVMLAGLRPSEATALRWSDIQATRISIDKSFVRDRVGKTKTVRSVRRITASRRLSAILERHRGEPGAWVACRGDGLPYSTNRLGSYWMRRACAALDIRRRGLYAGRRWKISDAITKGASLGHVAAYCGTSVSKIERSYYRYLGALSDPGESPRRRHKG